MKYKTIKLDNLNDDQIKNIVGVNFNNISSLKNIYNVDINFRSNQFMFYSYDGELFNIFQSHIDKLIELATNNIVIDDISIRQSYKSIIDDIDLNWQNTICCYGYNNKAFIYKTYNQYLLSKSLEKNDLVFSIGPAGTGKTFISVLLAYKYYKEGLIEKIILTRPAVETGESLGFLPGDLQEKVDPYLSPIYDALYMLFGNEQVANLKEKNVIEIIPLAYMRGRTLNNSFIILDEAQNTTKGQMLMFLTRLGNHSKMIVNGDLGQIDLNLNKVESGLVTAHKKLSNIDGIGFINFTNEDIIRNKLVKTILEKFGS